MDPACKRSFIEVYLRYFMVFYGILWYFVVLCGGHPINRLIVTMCDILHDGRRQPKGVSK